MAPTAESLFLSVTISGHADIRNVLGHRFILRAVDWMDRYVPAGSHNDALPARTKNCGLRGLLTEPSVATTE